MEEELAAGEKMLFTLSKTRKGYVIEYFCAVFLLSLPFFATMWNFLLTLRAQRVLFLLGVVVVLYAEISRIYVRYKITTKKIIIISGLLRQNKKNVYFHPLAFIPDINVEQNIVQRVFNFGTISVRGSEDNAFEIKDIDDPHAVMKEVERLIDETRVDGGAVKR